MAMVSAIVTLFSCEKDNGKDNENETGHGIPTIEWPGNEDFDVMDIDDNLNAKLVIKAPAGISTFVVAVDSELLEEVLSGMGLTDRLDLINDPAAIITLSLATGDTLPTGSKLKDQTEVQFDIAGLLTLITELPDVESGSEHKFTVEMTDNDENELSKACTFRVVETAEPAE